MTGGRTLNLVNGFLLGVEGDVEGWRVCPGDLEQQVVSDVSEGSSEAVLIGVQLVWKGNDTGCVQRYVQAVKQTPY